MDLNLSNLQEGRNKMSETPRQSRKRKYRSVRAHDRAWLLATLMLTRAGRLHPYLGETVYRWSGYLGELCQGEGKANR